MIEIRTGNRRAAFEAPFNVYAKDGNYISPMWSDLDRIWDPARNPLVRDGHGRFELFTAHRDGLCLGRIVATIHDASNKRHGGAHGQFGFFDCADDDEAASALLNAAESWLRERGMTDIIGNFNMTAMQMAGVLTGGFENAPYTDMMWNPPHIPAQLARYGYSAIFPMTTFETDLAGLDVASFGGEQERAVINDPAFTWAPINRRSFGQRLDDARVVLNAAFDKNPMFVPLMKAEFDFQAGEMMWILDPRLSVVVYHEGRPAGVIVCIPDLNPTMRAVGSRMSWTLPWHFLKHRMNRTRAVIIYYAVIPELHGKRLNGAMLTRLLEAAKGAGYQRLGGTWIADVNKPSLRQVERYGAQPLHRLHLYRKSLVAA